MDPYEFARQQGQVAGKPASEVEEPGDAEDLMDLLVQAYVIAGHLNDASDAEQVLVTHFAEFSNNYLASHRVVSTGIIDGEFSLVFESGRAVPLSRPEQIPARPDPVVPITTPRDSKMKGMNVIDTSVPITTGSTGSPIKRPR